MTERLGNNELDSRFHTISLMMPLPVAFTIVAFDTAANCPRKCVAELPTRSDRILQAYKPILRKAIVYEAS